MSGNVVTIGDSQSGSHASILVSQGFNLYSFSVVSRGQPVELFWAEEGFESGDKRPSGSGIPLLFPFAGRIGGMSFEWEGASYPQEHDDHQGNAIHGFVLSRPWRVIEQADDRLVGEFWASQDDAELAERWPADFRIRATYHVSGNQLEAAFELANPGSAPLPFSFGAHPYFRLPLGPAGTSGECRVQVPTARQWELKDMLPTGLAQATEQTALLASGAPLGVASYDDVFGELTFQDDVCTTGILDEANARRLVLTFQKPFRECVVYTPPHRQAVCLEPYTAVPDAFRLAEAGIDAGRRILEPGASLTCRMEVRLEDL